MATAYRWSRACGSALEARVPEAEGLGEEDGGRSRGLDDPFYLSFTSVSSSCGVGSRISPGVGRTRARERLPAAPEGGEARALRRGHLEERHAGGAPRS